MRVFYVASFLLPPHNTPNDSGREEWAKKASGREERRPLLTKRKAEWNGGRSFPLCVVVCYLLRFSHIERETIPFSLSLSTLHGYTHARAYVKTTTHIASAFIPCRLRTFDWAPVSNSYYSSGTGIRRPRLAVNIVNSHKYCIRFSDKRINRRKYTLSYMALECDPY